jgi:hypothetical protein
MGWEYFFMGVLLHGLARNIEVGVDGMIGYIKGCIGFFSEDLLFVLRLERFILGT